jgi:hypothetical protein
VQPLRVVPAAVGHPGNGVFAALCMTLLCAGLVGLLMLNTAMAEGSFTLHNLQSTSGELADTQDALTQAIDAQRSPAHLATRATRLGMVPADSAAFLRLSDGKVLGVAKPAKKESGFTVVTAPAATSTKAAQSATTKRNEPSTRVTKKGDVTTTTVVVTKPDGSVQTTVTSVNAKTTTTTSTTTTKPAPKKPVTTPTPNATTTAR